MTKQTRQLAAVITGQNTTDGAGVKLKRIVSQQQKNAFDPFILLDEFGSDEPADYKKKRSTDKEEQGVNDPMMRAAERLYEETLDPNERIPWMWIEQSVRGSSKPGGWRNSA